MSRTGVTHIEPELGMISVMVNHLEPGSIIIDGGANSGFFSVPVGNWTRGRDIRVLAFEPQRCICHALAGTVLLNKLDHVLVYNQALGSQPGWCRHQAVDYGQPRDFGMVTVEAVMEDHRDYLDTAQCEMVTIDGLALPRLDFLKLDVEGHEVAALQGGRNMIGQHRPWIWIEYFIIGAAAIQNELAYLPDYDFYAMDHQNMLCAPRERVQRSGITITS